MLLVGRKTKIMQSIKKNICIIIVLVSLNCFSQNIHSNTILTQVNEMGQSFVKKDYKTLIKYTHPKIMQLMGGREKMIGIIKNQLESAEKQGITFADAKFGEPSELYTVGKELQCTIVQSLELKAPNGKLIANATLIGFSQDGGKNWVFLDPSQGLDKLRTILPNISNKIVIPAKEQPQFYPD